MTKITVFNGSVSLYFPELNYVPREGEWLTNGGVTFFRVIGVLYKNKGYEVEVYTEENGEPYFAKTHKNLTNR